MVQQGLALDARGADVAARPRVETLRRVVQTVRAGVVLGEVVGRNEGLSPRLLLPPPSVVFASSRGVARRGRRVRGVGGGRPGSGRKLVFSEHVHGSEQLETAGQSKAGESSPAGAWRVSVGRQLRLGPGARGVRSWLRIVVDFGVKQVGGGSDCGRDWGHVRGGVGSRQRAKTGRRSSCLGVLQSPMCLITS